MISNYTEKGWEIITQRSHAMLAAQICARWKKSLQGERWPETLIATSEHDDIYNEFERGPLVSSNGGPIDFTMTGFDLDACEKLMDMAITKGSFIALLIGRRISFTHGAEPGAKNFLAKLARNKYDWMETSGASESEVSKAYELLEFCDAFSLLLCQGVVPPEQRSLEISKGPDGKMYSLMEKDGRLIVSPWPFEIAKFEVNYEFRIMESMIFSDDDAFRKQFRNVEVRRRVLQISRQ